jgi:hypothetical protein
MAIANDSRGGAAALALFGLVIGCGGGGELLGSVDGRFGDASFETDAIGIPEAGEGADARDLGDSPAAMQNDRGRVFVRDGNVLTDKGTRLRGVTIGTDLAPTFPLGQELFDTLAQQDGLNTVHVYLENRMQPTGASLALADKLVEMTSHARMYLIIGMGGGSANGTYDIDKVRAFWSLYAERYKDRTHVLYEIQNQPEVTTCGAMLSAPTMAMENEMYRSIRAAAPDSHILLLSFGDLPSADVLRDALARLNGVDWSKASVSIHSANQCVMLVDLPPVLAAARQGGKSILVSEIALGTPVGARNVFEQAAVGWMDFQWLVVDRSPDTFRQQFSSAGVRWCPDFGDWPQSSTCLMQ